MMDNNVFNLRIQQNMHGRSWDLFGWAEDLMTKKRSSAKPIVVEHSDENFLTPMVQLRTEEIQVLMDDLWIAGVRPSKRLLEEVPMDHLKGEVEWTRKIIERLLPGRKR
jgi:hypothetical protein